MEYKYLPEHVDLMKEQVWECKEDLGVYGELSDFEYEQFKAYLPQFADIHLEFGCGLGRGAVQIDQHYKNIPFHNLVDRHGRTENKGIFFPQEDEFYNDLHLTRSFMEVNGVHDFSTYDSENPDSWADIALDPVNLVTSRCSLGFHVPIHRYIDRLILVSSPDVTMIFGVNGHTPPNIVDGFKSQFRNAIFKPGKHNPRFPFQHWLILEGLINA